MTYGNDSAEMNDYGAETLVLVISVSGGQTYMMQC
jgi:hypothetical protein